MAMITNDWLDSVSAEFKKPYYRDLYDFVKKNTAPMWYIHRQMISLMPCT